MNAEFAKRLPGGREKFPRFFFAYGDTARQQILPVFEPGEEICVNDNARLFKFSRPAISHHLKVLRESQSLVCRKRGKKVYYRVNRLCCIDGLHVVHEFVASRSGLLPVNTKIPVHA